MCKETEKDLCEQLKGLCRGKRPRSWVGPAAGVRASNMFAPGTRAQKAASRLLCPLPAFSHGAEAYVAPSGAVDGFSFYLLKCQHAKCKGGTHSSWLSPDIHPRLHLREL